LVNKGLKVTPQRMSVLEAVYSLHNHPTAENIISEIRQKHPHIAIGTVYKILETLVENKIIKRVKTDKDIMRYDGIYESHHHLYCSTCDLIEDYNDNELDKILRDYFKSKELAGFKIEEFVLQIKGKFDKC
ncbi:MAG: transcriptional repressor, partial [Bacteroidales bacterium]|nr:transcriptional repressor [Bacteroidales bacterium]